MLRAWGEPEALMVLLPVFGSWRWMFRSGGVARAEYVSDGVPEEEGDDSAAGAGAEAGAEGDGGGLR